MEILKWEEGGIGNSHIPTNSKLGQKPFNQWEDTYHVDSGRRLLPLFLNFHLILGYSTQCTIYDRALLLCLLITYTYNYNWSCISIFHLNIVKSWCILFYMKKFLLLLLPFFCLFLQPSRIWNKGLILMVKLSKQLHQSPWYDRIIYRWCHCLPGGQIQN